MCQIHCLHHFHQHTNFTVIIIASFDLKPKINTDITTTQIAMNYIVAKGCVPVVSIATPKQAEELIGCMGWSLTDEEVQELDNAADLCEMNG